MLVDWANVYGWKQEVGGEPDSKKILDYFENYSEINEVRFYFGTEENNERSIDFIKMVKKLGYMVITKPVKFIKIFDDNGKKFISKRKCDFDLEIGLDTFELLDKYQSFIFLSGDGDYKTLYERLIAKSKQVIVVYARNRLGKEIWQMKKGIFKIEFPKLGILIKNVPPVLKPRGVIRKIIAKN